MYVYIYIYIHTYTYSDAARHPPHNSALAAAKMSRAQNTSSPNSHGHWH